MKTKPAFIKNILKHLSVFDFILMAVFLATALFFYLFFYRSTEYVVVKVKVTEQDVLYAERLPQNWYATSFSAGDMEKDLTGKKVAEVTNVSSLPISTDRYVVFLEMRLLATYNSRTNSYSVRGRQIAFGSPVRFTLNKVTFDGIIVDFPGLDVQKTQKTYKVSLLARGVEPAVADVFIRELADGLEDVEGVIKVEKVDVVPAERVTPNDAGRLLLSQDPLYKDMRLEATIVADLYQNKPPIIFNTLSLRVGEPLPLITNKATAYTIVTDFEEVQ